MPERQRRHALPHESCACAALRCPRRHGRERSVRGHRGGHPRPKCKERGGWAEGGGDDGPNADGSDPDPHAGHDHGGGGDGGGDAPESSGGPPKELCACAALDSNHPFTIDCSATDAIRAAKVTLDTKCGEPLEANCKGTLEGGGYSEECQVAFFILQAVDPTTFQLLSQMKTIFTGLLFRVFLKRKLTTVQYLALVVLACGTACSQIPTAKKAKGGAEASAPILERASAAGASLLSAASSE